MENFYSQFVIAADTDFYRTPIIADEATGKRVRFVAHQVPSQGWTVAKVIGSRKQGRTIEPVSGYCTTYTMHQAATAADALTRDTFRSIRA